MIDVFYNPTGGLLFANAVFLGNMDASYAILRERDSGAQTMLLTGDNLNPTNDITSLSSPAK